MAISSETIMDVVNDYFPSKVIINWRGIDITCKTFIDIENMERMVELCSQTAFNEDGTYSHVGVDLSIKVFILRMFTDIELPDNIEEIVRIIYSTDLYEYVLSHISPDQVECICTAIDKAIYHTLNINENSYVKEVNKIIASLDDLGEKYGDIFGDINNDDLKAMVSNLTSHEITEEGLVDAILKQKSMG